MFSLYLVVIVRVLHFVPVDVASRKKKPISCQIVWISGIDGRGTVGLEF